MDCADSFMKYLLLFFNFIIFVCGAVILGVGIWVKVDPDVTRYVNLVVSATDTATFNVAVVVLIAVGTFIFLVGFLGCCGACQESECLLTSYAVLMILLVIMEIVAACLVIAFKSKVGEKVQLYLQKEVETKYTTDKTELITRTFNELQVKFKCCGGMNLTDYRGSNYTTVSGNVVPESCCVGVIMKGDTPTFPPTTTNTYAACKQAATAEETDNEKVYYKGCFDGFKGFLDSQSTVVIGVAFGIALVQILAIIFACCVKGNI